MNPLSELKEHRFNGMIPEKEILKNLPEDIVPIWEKYMRGKTVQEIGFDDWGIYDYDYDAFRRHIINLCLKHMADEDKEKRAVVLDELTKQAQNLDMGY